MFRKILSVFVLLWLVGNVAVMAQDDDENDTVLVTAENRQLQFSIPADWNAYDVSLSGDGLLFEIFDNDEGRMIRLYMFDIRPWCDGGGLPGPVIPNLRCNQPEDEDVLAFFMEVELNRNLDDTGQFDVQDEMTYFFWPFNSDFGIKNLGNSLYLIAEWMPAGSSGEVPAEIAQLLQTAVIPGFTVDEVSERTLTEDGWTLDLTELNVGNVIQFVLGGDGLIYALTDAQILITFNENGDVTGAVRNPYLGPGGIQDFAVSPDGIIWVVWNGELYRIDPETQLAENTMLNTIYIHEIELGPDGNLYLLTMGTPHVRIYTPELERIRIFSIYDEAFFPFLAEPFLSMTVLGVSPQNEVFVAELGVVRVFDTNGAVITPFFAQDVGVERFAFDEDGTIYYATSNSIQMVNDGEEITLTPPSSVYLILPDGDIVWYADSTITRQPLQE